MNQWFMCCGHRLPGHHEMHLKMVREQRFLKWMCFYKAGLYPLDSHWALTVKFCGRRDLVASVQSHSLPGGHHTPEHACVLVQVPSDSWCVLADCLEDCSHLCFETKHCWICRVSYAVFHRFEDVCSLFVRTLFCSFPFCSSLAVLGTAHWGGERHSS